MAQSPEQLLLKQILNNAVTKTEDTPDQTLALGGGMNFRINVAKALKAAFLSTKTYIKAKVMIVTGTVNPAEALGMAKDVWDIVVTTLDALRERMGELEYVACVVLSGFEDGVSREDFEKELKDVLASELPPETPWYLGLTTTRLETARNSFKAVKNFDEVLQLLRDEDWLDEAGGKYKFKPRHYTWGFSLS